MLIFMVCTRAKIPQENAPLELNELGKFILIFLFPHILFPLLMDNQENQLELEWETNNTLLSLFLQGNFSSNNQ